MPAPNNPYATLAAPFPARRVAPRPGSGPGLPAPHLTPRATGVVTASNAGAAPALSDEQRAVVADPGSSLIVVNSFAGTGKTSTAQAYAAARPHKRFLYLCFNKANQIEASSRFGANVQARTTHSIALQALRSHVGQRLASSWRAKTLSDEFPMIGTHRQAALAHAVLLSFFQSPDLEIGPEQVLRLHGWNPSPAEESNALSIARHVWKDMLAQNSRCSIPHDGYLKLFALTSPQLPYDCIIFDEAQDANPVTEQIVRNQHLNGAQVLCIGDRYQSIYGFRGSVNAMESFGALPGAAHYHLTRTWRFGPAIAQQACAVLEHLLGEPRPLVGMGPPGAKAASTQTTRLSRTNAQLLTEAIPILGAGVHWLGGVDNYSVMRLADAYALWIRNLEGVSDPFLRSFGSWAKYKGYGDETRDAEILTLARLVEEHKHEVPRLIDAIRANAVAQPQEADFVFTTAHKSKGLDWDHVRLCDDMTIARDLEERLQADPTTPLSGPERQDAHLLYVAITRARRTLTLDPSTQWWLDNLKANLQLRAAATRAGKNASSHPAAPAPRRA